MSREIIIRKPAERDLSGHYDFIAADNPNAAERFLIKFMETANDLLLLPEMGRAWMVDISRLMGTRFFPIKDFGKYLIFYRPTEKGIIIIRVLHSAQDINSILG